MRSPIRIATLFALACVVLASGCSEVRGRKKIQEANKLYKDGNYKEAIALFDEAEKLIPDFPTLWLNKGYTCRQMVVPGAKTPESAAGAKCALDAFKKYMTLAPNDTRGEMLYVQTLFDSDEFETLSKMYEDRFAKNPRDIDAITGLIQVYSKWNKIEDALQWVEKRAEVQANDPEAQYGVGTFIWQQLMQRGGGPDKQVFDPRPNPNKPKEKKFPPAFAPADIISQQRVDMADNGIKYLQKAIEMRPKYHEAMTYIGLLYRQKSFALFDDPPEWEKAVLESARWTKRSLEAQGKAIPASLDKVLKDGPTTQAAEGGDEPAAAPAAEEATTPAKGKAKGKAAKGSKGSKKAAHKGKHAGRN